MNFPDGRLALSGIVNFDRTMKSLGKTFYTPEEFPFVVDRLEAERERALVERLAEQDVYGYALSLSGRQLDFIIFSLVLTAPSNRVAKLLSYRFTKRLARLSWILFQHHPSSGVLPWLVVNNASRLHGLSEKDGVLMFSGGFLENSVGSVVNVMFSERVTVDSFIDKYRLIVGSPFFTQILETFYTYCEPSALMQNYDHLYNFISNLAQPEASPVVKHYLVSVQARDYHAPINLYLIDRLGMPYYESEAWAFLSNEVIWNVAQWYKLHLLDSHLVVPSRKHTNLVERLDRISYIAYDPENGVLRIDFGSFALFDPEPESDTMYLFKDAKRGMSITPEEFKDIIITLEARNFIVEEAETDIYKLYFFEFGKLYAGDMMDMYLGISE
jgi:hypothetical protein